VSFFKDSYGLPISNPAAVPAATGYITRTLPPDIVNSLRTAANANGCSIFSLVYATMALTSLRIYPPSEERLQSEISYPCVIAPVDLRHLITDDPYDKTQWKARLAIGHAPYTTRDLGRFVHPQVTPDLSAGGDEQKQLGQDVWALSKEIAAQLAVYKKYSDRAAVWTEEVLWAAMASTAPSNAPPTTA